MEATYVRDSNDHYLVLPIDELSEGEYQMPMLLQNHIPGLLPVHMQTIDGARALYYEVTSFRSLSSSFEAEKMDLNMIRKILMHMNHMAEEIDRYLLRGNGIIWNPEYIFINMDRTEICFCYDPCRVQTGAEGLNSIARFILDHIDYEDRECTSLAYSLFQESMKANVSIVDFAKMAIGYSAEEGDEKYVVLPKGQTDCIQSLPQKQDGEMQTQRLVDESKMEKGWKKYVLEVLILGSLSSVLMIAFLCGLGVLGGELILGSKVMVGVSAGGMLLIQLLVITADRLIVHMGKQRLQCNAMKETRKASHGELLLEED